MSMFPRRRRSATRLHLLSRLDQEVREEVRFYLEMRVGELEARGLEAEEAWRQALEAFGDPEEVVEETKQAYVKGSAMEEGSISGPASLGTLSSRYAHFAKDRC